MVRTKRFLVLALEVVVALALAGLALAIGGGGSLPIIAAALWVVALSSAAHDACADGIYVTALSRKGQALWLPARTAISSVARALATTGVFALGAELMMNVVPDARIAWMSAIAVGALAMAALAGYHALVLPTGSLTRQPKNIDETARALRATVASFFQKKSMGRMLGVVSLLSVGEGLSASGAVLFMQGKPREGGLPITLSELAMTSTVGSLPRLGAMVLGSVLVAQFGLRRMLVFLTLGACARPLACVLLTLSTSPDHPGALLAGGAVMSVGQLGEAFGSVAIPLYLMHEVAPGEHAMSHYAFAAGIAALLRVPPHTVSGFLADAMGHRTFFVVALLVAIAGVIAASKAPFSDAGEGAR
jgi:PAT family beta-lactamase induction signal transducer AmpG